MLRGLIYSAYRTPFHSDVLRSHSWSANICGTKQWTFLLPGEEEKVRDKFNNLPFDLRSCDLEDVRTIEFVQREGELVFVPSGWFHQVHNLVKFLKTTTAIAYLYNTCTCFQEDTISINHNWINGSNIGRTWEFLCQSLDEVKKEISDCKDMDGWHAQCQVTSLPPITSVLLFALKFSSL